MWSFSVEEVSSIATAMEGRLVTIVSKGAGLCNFTERGLSTESVVISTTLSFIGMIGTATDLQNKYS